MLDVYLVVTQGRFVPRVRVLDMEAARAAIAATVLLCGEPTEHNLRGRAVHAVLPGNLTDEEWESLARRDWAVWDGHAVFVDPDVPALWTIRDDLGHRRGAGPSPRGR